MYQLVSAIAKPLSGNNRWRNVNIANIAMSALFAGYKEVIATLSNNFLDHNVSFNIESLRSQWGASSVTFSDFLVQNGNLTLATSDTLPVINVRYAGFADAEHAGYLVTPTHPTAAPTSEMPESDKTWLFMTRDDTDYAAFYQKCLVNVNGFYHLTDHSTQGIYVVDGMKSTHLSGRNQIGILSFDNIGSFNLMPISPLMVYKQNSDQSLKNNCYIETGLDLSNKTVLLVLGGYLHIQDAKTFRRVSPSAFAVDFSNLPLIDRYYESFGVIDLSSLGLESLTANPSQISIEQLYSDAALTKYLTLAQSFLVVLDNAEIFTEKVMVQDVDTPNNYITQQSPVHAFVVGAGRHEPFWYKHEYGQYSITVKAAQKFTKLYNTVTTLEQNSVSNAIEPFYGAPNAMAFWLKIGTDL